MWRKILDVLNQAWPALLIATVGVLIALLAWLKPRTPRLKPRPETTIIHELVKYLSGKGVLQNPYYWEDRAGVYASLSNIRSELERTLQLLGPRSSAQQSVIAMRDSARMTLQDPKVFPEGPRTPPGSIGDSERAALGKLRKTYFSALIPLKTKYPLLDIDWLAPAPAPTQGQSSTPQAVSAASMAETFPAGTKIEVIWNAAKRQGSTVSGVVDQACVSERLGEEVVSIVFTESSGHQDVAILGLDNVRKLPKP